jgi:hypothetical protein
MIDYFFTSINNGYLPKARILAKSVRQHYPSAQMVLALSDRRDPALDYSDFDLILTPEDLGIDVPNLEAWLFEHTVVELCTAVKPFAFRYIYKTLGAKTVVYMDPDTVLFSPMRELEETLRQNPIVLTPHVSKPASDLDDLLDGEMLGCLRHGVFNLGFLALRFEGEGPDFLQWWLDRCRDFCFDDNQRGLFTDQKWIDLAPCFFETLAVLRVPSYNVATWNLYYRQVERNSNGELTVNKAFPLRFFHFSGFDIGTHKHMLKKHAGDNQTLIALTEWYEEEAKGLSNSSEAKSYYEQFPNGVRIPADWRRYYRQHPALQSMIPKPYQQYESVISHFSGKPVQKLERWGYPYLKRASHFVRRRPALVRLIKSSAPPQIIDRLKRVLG